MVALRLSFLEVCVLIKSSGELDVCGAVDVFSSKGFSLIDFRSDSYIRIPSCMLIIYSLIFSSH